MQPGALVALLTLEFADTVHGLFRSSIGPGVHLRSCRWRRPIGLCPQWWGMASNQRLRPCVGSSPPYWALMVCCHWCPLRVSTPWWLPFSPPRIKCMWDASFSVAPRCWLQLWMWTATGNSNAAEPAPCFTILGGKSTQVGESTAHLDAYWAHTSQRNDG